MPSFGEFIALVCVHELAWRNSESAYIVAGGGYLNSEMSDPATDPPTATALRLYVILTRASEALHAHARAHIAAQGLIETEFAILEALYHKGHLLLGEVQKKILVSSGGITFLIDKLEFVSPPAAFVQGPNGNGTL